MNSMDVAMIPPAVMIFGTAAMASSGDLNSTSRSTHALGSGMSLSVILVKMPSVPSLPTMSWIML